MISVVIPTCNGSEKILSPIYSVIQQTYHDTEIIVVDDNGAGSDEQLHTEHNLRDLIESQKIKYIVHEKNANGSAARNTGFRAAKGEYVNFLDDDDVMLPAKLAAQAKILDESACDAVAVVCGTYFAHKDGTGFIRVPDCDCQHLQRDYLCEKVKFNTSAILFKRTAVEKLGGFDESFRRHQDWEFCFRLMEDHKFLSCNEVLLIKYATARNLPSSPEKAEEYFDHFHSTLKPYFERMDEKDYRDVILYNHRRLLRGYILARKLRGGRLYVKRKQVSIGQIIITLFDILKLAANKIIRSSKPLVQSYDIYAQEAKREIGHHGES